MGKYGPVWTPLDSAVAAFSGAARAVALIAPRALREARRLSQFARNTRGDRDA